MGARNSSTLKMIPVCGHVILPEIIGLLYFAQDAQVAHWVCQCIIDNFPDAQYMRKIIPLSPMAIYGQDLHKIVLLSPMRNICARL